MEIPTALLLPARAPVCKQEAKVGAVHVAVAVDVGAREMTGISDPQALLNHVLNQFVRVISLETLTKGGWDPHLGAPPRRRPSEFMNDAPESPSE